MNRTTLINPDGGIHTSTFDSLNRQVTYQLPGNAVATTAYDNGSRISTVTSEFGGLLLRTFDALNRVITLIQQTAAASPVATVVDAYDVAGRKTSQSRDGLITTYTNDNAGRLTGQTGAGVVATFNYDNADNVLLKWQQGGLAVTQTFDAANRILSMVQGSATTNYTYNATGTLALEAQGVVQTGYVYDGENRLTKLTNPDGTVITNTYSGGAMGLRRTTQQPGTNVSTMIWDGQNYLGQM